MYTLQELLKIRPWDEEGAWREDAVAEYLIWACNIHCGLFLVMNGSDNDEDYDLVSMQLF